MVSSRVARLILVSVALSGAASLSAAPAPVSAIARRVYFRPETPLDQIPLYSLSATSPEALRSLEAEINRLYEHVTTLESGPENRVLRAKIYVLEKQLWALSPRFNATAWESLRAAVKAEWLDVQATLPVAKPSPAAEASASKPASSLGSGKA